MDTVIRIPTVKLSYTDQIVRPDGQLLFSLWFEYQVKLGVQALQHGLDVGKFGLDIG